MNTDRLWTTAHAAAQWGVSPQNLIRLMRRRGHQPLVEHIGRRVQFWWEPTQVLLARRDWLKPRVPNISHWNRLPKDRRQALTLNRRMERLRRYYQAKAASRAAA